MNNALLSCAVGDTAWLKRCLSSRFSLSTTDKEGLTCLHLAAKNGHLDCLRHLLDSCSLDVDEAEATSGRSALHFSVSNKRGGQTSLRCVRLLLERGADPNRRSREGLTPLHEAASAGHARCVKKLLDHGADIHLTDGRGRTACDVATLHGQFECARLLRSLHWARRKDRELKSELQEKTERRRRQHERALIESRLKKETADIAYHQWAQRRSKSIVEPPAACRERQDLKSQSQSPHSCSSCNTASRRSSGRQSSPAKLTATIVVTLHQAKRNIECAGRPAKLHPYSNYPPRKQQRPPSNRTLERTGRSSRATNPPSPAPMKMTTDDRSPEQAAREVAQPEQENSSSDSLSGGEEEQCDVATREPPASELNLGGLLRSSEPRAESAEDVEVQFLVGGVGEEEEGDTEPDYDGDDDIAFHDVGKANSLNSLSLPGTLTKNRTLAGVLKLLKQLGSSGGGPQLSHHARRRSFSCSLPRRFSLGAIPEGQMVTTYSNESVASLGEQSSWLRLAADPVPGGQVQEEGGVKREGEADNKGDDRQGLQQDVGEEEPSDTSQTEVEETEGGREGGAGEERKTLKIVNLVWDAASSTVQTSITESPMTPLSQSWHPFPRPLVSPPSTPSHHSSPTSPTPVTTPSNISSSHHKSSGASSKPVLLRSNSSHFPSSSFSRELEDLQEADSSHNLISPEADLDKSLAPPTAPSFDQPPLPAHSLFGSLMGGVASKSMVSLAAAAAVDTPPTGEASMSQTPQPRRRIKSAPDMFHLQHLPTAEEDSCQTALETTLSSPPERQ